MKRSVLFTFFIGYTVCLFAQVPIKVLDAKTLKPLVGANVYIDRKDGIAVTDSNGVFSISDNIDLTENDTIVVSFVGYVSQHFTLSGIRKRSTILLFEKVESLEEVSVFGRMDMNLRLPYVELASLPKRLYSFASIIEGDSIYVIGGDESQVSIFRSTNIMSPRAKPNIIQEQCSDKLYIYDISSDRWITSRCIFKKRAYQAVASYENRFYVLGGKYYSTNRKIEFLDPAIEIYDRERDTIVIDPVNPHQAINFASFLYDGNIIVMGGSVGRNALGWKNYNDQIHLFNLKTGYWYELGKMPQGKETSGVLIGHTIYLFGGFHGQKLTEIETYDLTNGCWRTLTELWFPVERPGIVYNEDIVYIFESNVIQTYNIRTNEVKAFLIDLNLQESGLFCKDDKLFIIGGCRRAVDDVEPFREVYKIDLSDFAKTEMHYNK